MMKSIAGAVIALAALTAGSAALAADESALAKSSGCLTCHAADAKKMGPSFKETAAKYKGKADAEATITAKLNAAKDHPKVKAESGDVTKLVKWILAM